MGGGWADPGYSLFWFGSYIRVELQPPKTLPDVNAPSYNLWHYLAFTWDVNSKLIQTYIDGVIAGVVVGPNSYAGPIGNPAQNLNIGKNAKQAGYVFNGIIDEARVQSISRSAGWIQTEYYNQGDQVIGAGHFINSVSAESPYNSLLNSQLNVCSGAVVTYSMPPQGGHTYTWIITGGTPTSFTGNSVTVTWGAAGTGTIQLRENNGSCDGLSPVYNVTINPLPTPVITGFINICPGASGIVYSTPFVAGHTYSWTIVGATIYSGENTNVLTVTWANVCNSTGTVKVTETITATGC